MNIFNRPDCTLKVLEILRSLKPGFLYVHADGPRPDLPVNRKNVRKQGILSGIRLTGIVRLKLFSAEETWDADRDLLKALPGFSAMLKKESSWKMI